MVSWSVRAVTETPDVDRTVLVFRRGERDIAERMLSDEVGSATVELVEGGDTRHGSEHNVLRHLADDIESGAVDVVLIHDAARPLAGVDLMRSAIATAREFGGAIPGLSPGDVLREAPDGSLVRVDGTLARVQTPQAFRAVPLLAAYRAAEAEGFDGTDTSACVQRFTDVDVHVFDGAATNFKVTFPHDVEVAARLLRNRFSGAGGPR
jgi:2-C-methyl-D-erythritol 4-phosphate cytidylyltransferase